MTLTFPRHARGAALFVVLIVLLLVSLMVLVGLRSSVLQERMTSGTRDRAMALQNAEAALAQAETALTAARSAAGAPGLDCSRPEDASSPVCLPHPSLAGVSASGRGWEATRDLQVAGTSAGAPAYALQYLGRRDSQTELGLSDEPNYGESSGRVEAEFYRVLSRGSDPQAAPDRSLVLLQSTVVRE